MAKNHKINCKCCICKTIRGESGLKKEYKWSKEIEDKRRKAVSLALKGKHCSPKTEFKKGHKLNIKENNPNFGKYGNLNPNWIDGSSFEPYPIKFNNKLKEKIRKRDNYTCQLCKIKEKDYYRKLDVHHIDYNKENCDGENLITLCNSCNIRVNYNRDHWHIYFQNILVSKEE